MKRILISLFSLHLALHSFAMPSSRSLDAASAWAVSHLMVLATIIATLLFSWLLSGYKTKLPVRLILYTVAILDVLLVLYALSTMADRDFYEDTESAFMIWVIICITIDLLLLWLGIRIFRMLRRF